MRTPCAALVLAGVWMAAVDARADVAESRSRLEIHRRPDRSSHPVKKVDAHTKMEVLESSPDGAWIKVQAGSRKGWVLATDVELSETSTGAPPPASAVAPETAPATAPAKAPARAPAATAADAPDSEAAPAGDEAPESPESRESKATTAGDDPAAASARVHSKSWSVDASHQPATVVVSESVATLVDRPIEGATAVAEVKRGDRLSSSRKSHDGKFVLVELDSGGVAWISSSAVSPEPVEPVGTGEPAGEDEAARPSKPSLRAPAPTPARSSRALPGAGPSSVLADGDAPYAAAAETAARQRFHLRLGAGVGFAQLDQAFSSNGRRGLSNYRVRTSLADVAVGLSLDAALKGGFFGGLEGAYHFSGGADLRAEDGARAATLGVRTHDVEATVLLGYRASSLGGLALSARVGGRLVLDLIDQSFVVPVPSERILALDVGLGLDVPHLVAGLGLSLSVSWLPVGSRSETPHLGEGVDGGTNGLSARLVASYAFTSAWALFVDGRYLRVMTHFDGAAERDPTISTGDRTTSLTTLGIGVRYSR